MNIPLVSNGMSTAQNLRCGKCMERNDFLNSYMEFTDESEAAVLFRKWVGISLVSSCLQRKTWMSWETDIYPNLYVVLVGSSGCRKGTAMFPGRKLLQEVGITVSPESTTREALIEVLTDINMPYTDPRFPNDAMGTHNSLTIYSTELSVFLRYDDRDLMSALTNWFDCEDPWRYLTKSRGWEEINKVWVTLVGATTPELIQVNLPQDAIGGGLTSRIIFIHSRPPSKPIPFPPNPFDNVEAVEKIKNQMFRMLAMEGPFEVTDEYRNLYGPWYVDTFSDNPFPNCKQLDPYLTRRSLHLRKLSMICCASRTNDMILKGEDFTKALDLLQEAERFMSSTFAGYGRLDYSQYIPQVLRMIIEKRELFFSEILAKFASDLNRGELEDIVAALVYQDLCRMETLVFRENGVERAKNKIWYTGEAMR